MAVLQGGPWVLSCMLCFHPDGGDLPAGGGPAGGVRLPVFSLPPLGGDPRRPLPTMVQSMAAGQPPPGSAPLLDPTDLTNQLEGMLGLATLPPKLLKRIVQKEYIEMYEILPESWRLETESASPSGQGKRPRRGPITDIDVWCECYAVLAAVLSAAYPGKAPHLFAYMRTIVRASRNFEGTAWVTYDMSFRRAAANRGSLDWGVPDPGRFNDAFVGRAKVIPRCSYCLSDTHTAVECPDAPAHKQSSALSGQIDQKLGGTPTRAPAAQQQSGGVAGLVQICRAYNRPEGPRCRFVGCRYAHLCDRCHRPHPGVECKERVPGGARARSPVGTRRWDQNSKQPR